MSDVRTSLIETRHLCWGFHTWNSITPPPAALKLFYIWEMTSAQTPVPIQEKDTGEYLL